MAKLKSQRHHWWPECVSDFWRDAEGGVHWLLPSGEVRKSTPNNFGVIGNGHQVRLGRTAGEATPFDECFESDFQSADQNFPHVIRWLQGLHREYRGGMPRRERFISQAASGDQIRQLIEGVISLAVRSPMNREAAVGVAERLRGPLPERERNGLIGANMRHSFKRAVQACGDRGKIAVIYSPDREFIFGDGFFHNLTSPAVAPMTPEVLVPLTPEISVLYLIPMRYRPEPQLSTVVIAPDEAIKLNNTIQVYAREALFYRSEKPDMLEEFRQARHLRYSRPDNPIAEFIHSLPGVPDRDTSLDFLADLSAGRPPMGGGGQSPTSLFPFGFLRRK